MLFDVRRSRISDFDPLGRRASGFSVPIWENDNDTGLPSPSISPIGSAIATFSELDIANYMQPSIP